MEHKEIKRAWVISADMGLGHQRAAFSLKDIAEKGIITAGDANIISKKEYKFWKKVRRTYEFLSRSRQVPIVGKYLFNILDYFQNIKPIYPRRDLSRPTIQTYYLSKLIKKGLGLEIIKYVEKEPKPLVTTFYVPALVADYYGYIGKIFCVICDADINRVWVASEPSRSRINYFAPCENIVKRLKRYGVNKDRIFMTGFPLPKENIGSREQMEFLKVDFLDRLHHLDPKGRFFKQHHSSLSLLLGPNIDLYRKRPLSITFAIGGAGAQADIALKLIKSFRELLIEKRITINISVGVRKNLQFYLEDFAKELRIEECLDRSLRIIYHPDKYSYFKGFNEVLRTTDILWTKPSELSFYCGLGIPIIIAPPIGSHEDYNMKWLMEIHAGVPQEDPVYAREWIIDWLSSGRLAEAALDGYLKAPKLGTFLIEDMIAGKKMDEIVDAHFYDTAVHFFPFNSKKG
ncbi:MAG: hypothetical protein AB1410_10730 [Acidobacteriota bacterium]